MDYKACMWLQEISSYSGLTAVPGPAYLLLNKMRIPFSLSLYTSSEKLCLALGLTTTKRRGNFVKKQTNPGNQGHLGVFLGI